MAKHYRQNASYKDIVKGDENDPQEDEKEKSSGNTGLPFGLCKKYGIALPPKATPRDAWNALKGIGIYPPWTEKGKDQYSSDPKDSSGEKEQISAHKKAIYDGIATRLSSFSVEYRDRLSQAMESLDENELEAIAATFDKAVYKQGDGAYRFYDRELTVPGDEVSAIDADLGYSFGAETFFHEYGHYLAHQILVKMSGEGPVVGEDGLRIHDFNALPEYQQVFSEDAKALLERAAKEAGLSGGVSVSRISGKVKGALYSMLQKASDKDIANLRKPIKPLLNESDRENLIYIYKTTYGFSDQVAQDRADQFLARESEDNERRMQKYRQQLAVWEENKDKVPKAKATFQRFGVISDFIAGATAGRVNPYKDGYWGHNDSYWKSQTVHGYKIPGKKNGVETWAEYVSAKMTKDEAGLQVFREYLPRTFAKYEELYSKMGGILSERPQ